MEGHPVLSSSTLARQLQEDSLFLESKAALLARVEAAQARLHFPGQSGDPEAYAALIAQVGQMRGAPLYFPYLSSGMGRGLLVELADGSVKYDLIAGIGVHFLGHGHPALLAAALDAALEDTVMQGNLQQSAVVADVARLLLERSGPLSQVFFSTSGAMANENALKIAFQARHPARRILAFERCFAGRTLALSSVTDKAAYREGLPETLAVDYLPFFDPNNVRSTENTLARLERFLQRYPGGHAAMILELVQGEAGFSTAPPEFFQAIVQRLRSAGILVIFDEVQTFGRTLQLFAAQHFGLLDAADIITVGKLTQICATLYRKEWQPRPGLLSQTFTGSTSAFYAARAVLTELSPAYYGSDGHIAKVAQETVAALAKVPGIHSIAALGSMISFVVGSGEPEKTRSFLQELFRRGVIAFSAGSEPLRVRFLLPVGGILREDLEAALVILAATVQSGDW